MKVRSSKPEFDHDLSDFDISQHLRAARRQAEDRGLDDVLIVDVDAHHYETDNMHEIIEYIEDPSVRQMIQNTYAYRGSSGFMLDQPGFQDVGGRVTRYMTRKPLGDAIARSGRNREVVQAMAWMDALSVNYACLFPTPMLLLGMHPQVEVEVQLARAYNRWLVENVLANSDRLVSMIYLPFNDPDAAYRCVQEFAGKKGVVGFMVCSTRYKGVYDNAYMKTYSLIEELGLPLGFHAGYYWNDPLTSMTNRFITAHALGFTFFNAVHCANWIVNGLPERFPKLNVVWIESGLAWVPWLMQRLDNDFRMRSSEAPSLKKLPSDYMRDMFYTSQPMEMVNNAEMLRATFNAINAGTQLLYSSDYPHWDMDLPSVIWDLPFLDVEQKKNILGGNAKRLFRLPDTRPLGGSSGLPTSAAKAT